MTYNIHHGRGLDNKVDIARTAQVIREINPDIVAIQEMDRWVERSGKVDQIAELSRLTGLEFYFEKNINYQGGEYGSGFLTRFPILQKTNYHYQMIRPNEQRGLLQMVLDVNGTKLAVMNTHIDWRPDDEERLLNVQEIKEAADRYTGMPLLVIGDFNDDPGSRTHLSMKETFVDVWDLLGKGDGFTWHGEERSKRLDYIFVRPSETITPITIQVVPADASDHNPVVAEFRLN
ncbi:MAG: endonuclease/exonuclease/phosphatase family protein [Limisphaerales bacterium]